MCSQCTHKSGPLVSTLTARSTTENDFFFLEGFDTVFRQLIHLLYQMAVCSHSGVGTAVWG